MGYELIKKYSKNIFDSNLDYYTWEELKDIYEGQLNEGYDSLKIGGLAYEAGTTLKKIDPIAFNCFVNEDNYYTEVIFNNEVRYYVTEDIEEFLDQFGLIIGVYICKTKENENV